MNHRPFEDWLLDDQPLTPEQKRDLQSHLRTCTCMFSDRRIQPGFALHTHSFTCPRI